MKPASNILVVAALWSGLSAACTEAPPPTSPTPALAVESKGMPAMQAADIQGLEGELAERLVAGHYTYVRIGDDWAVLLGSVDAEPGDPIAVSVQGAQTDFHSRRLGRDFERLYFATRKDPT